MKNCSINLPNYLTSSLLHRCSLGSSPNLKEDYMMIPKNVCIGGFRTSYFPKAFKKYITNEENSGWQWWWRHYDSMVVVRSKVHSWFAEDWNLFLWVQIKFFVVVEILQEDIDFHTLVQRPFPGMFTTVLRIHPHKSALSPYKPWTWLYSMLPWGLSFSCQDCCLYCQAIPTFGFIFR